MRNHPLLSARYINDKVAIDIIDGITAQEVRISDLADSSHHGIDHIAIRACNQHHDRTIRRHRNGSYSSINSPDICRHASRINPIYPIIDNSDGILGIEYLDTPDRTSSRQSRPSIDARGPDEGNRRPARLTAPLKVHVVQILAIENRGSCLESGTDKRNFHD